MTRRLIDPPEDLDAAIDAARGPHTISAVYILAAQHLVATKAAEQIRRMLAASGAPLRGGTQGRPKNQASNPRRKNST